jgi:dTDP-4-dehydrorhamnose reductase
MTPDPGKEESAEGKETPSARTLRAVVIGGSGQIGGWLLRFLAERGHWAVGTYCGTAFPGLVHLDAADLSTSAAWLRSQAPDVVFYPAGFTWVDGCQRDPRRAYAANLDQPISLAQAAADSGARFFYFSTDYVFDGENGPYAEEAPTNPLSVYGQAKRDAEQELDRALGDRQLTLRTSWVFGPERQGKNFAYQALRSLSEQKPVVCPSDQISSPSYGPDVARAAVLLAEQHTSGLVHLVGPEVMDRPTFARAIAAAFGYDGNLIEAKSTRQLGQEAPRPLRGGLVTHRLDSLLPAAMRPLALAPALADFRARLLDPELQGWVQSVPGFPAR